MKIKVNKKKNCRTKLSKLEIYNNMNTYIHMYAVSQEDRQCNATLRLNLFY